MRKVSYVVTDVDSGEEYAFSLPRPDRGLALKEAKEWILSPYDPEDFAETIFASAIIYGPGFNPDGERETFVLYPSAPYCSNGERNGHIWLSPVEIVGGIKENPGVFGRGGGVIIREICPRCGTEMATDTWATNPEDGSQGWRTVSYHPHKYDFEEIIDRMLSSSVSEEELQRLREAAISADPEDVWPDGASESPRKLRRRLEALAEQQEGSDD